MAVDSSKQRVFEDLAELYAQRGDAKKRDIFLVLAADAAHADGKLDEAEKLRHRLMLHSPNNLFRPFFSWREALESADVQTFLDSLRRRFPVDKAAKLLQEQRQATPASALAPGPYSALLDDEKNLYPLAETLAAPAPASPWGLPLKEKPADSARDANKRSVAIAPGVVEQKPALQQAPGGFAWIFFVVMLLLSAALAAYVFARPWLPEF